MGRVSRSASINPLFKGAHEGLEGDQDRRWWIVHFAPSSAKHVSPILDKFFNVSGTVTEGDTRRPAHVATIGPTTATSLKEELGMEVHVVASKPTPEALAEGIEAWDRDHLPTTEVVR